MAPLGRIGALVTCLPRVCFAQDRRLQCPPVVLGEELEGRGVVKLAHTAWLPTACPPGVA